MWILIRTYSICGSKVYIQTNNLLCKYALWAFIWGQAHPVWSKFISFISMNFNMKKVSRVMVMLNVHHSFAYCVCCYRQHSVRFPEKLNIQEPMLKSIKLTQHQERLPDTPGESRVSVLMQTFWKMWVCQTVHSDFTLLAVWSTAIMNLKLLFFFLFLAVLLTPAEVCIICICCTAIVWQ